MKKSAATLRSLDRAKRRELVRQARAAVRGRGGSTSALYPVGRRAGRGAYDGARRDLRELKTWLPALTSPAADTIPDLPTLRARTLDLDRNDAIAKGAIDTTVEHVVGTGLMPVPAIDHEQLGLTRDQANAWNRRALKLFQAVANTTRLDLQDRHTFLQLQWLALRGALGAGDTFALRRYDERPGDILGLKLQLFEGMRCSTPQGRMEGPQLLDGIEMDAVGRPVRYWFSSGYPGETLYPQILTWSGVEAYGAESGERQVLHVMEALRVDQVRGVPLLAPVIKPLKELASYRENELRAAVVSSLLTVLITSEHPLDDGPGLEDLDGGDGQHFGPPGLNENEVVLAPGAVGRLDPGEKIETVNPSRPNAQFDPFVSAVAQFVGAGIGIPYELLIKRFNASYSASRASLLQAWRSFDRRQTWLVESFCQPVYEWILSEAIARGYLDAPGFDADPFVRAAYCRAEWRGPTMGQIDPLKEVLAAERRIAIGVSTHSQEAASLTGLDAQLVHEQLVLEKRARIQDGLELPLGGQSTTGPTRASDVLRGTAEPEDGDAPDDEEGSPADGMDEPEELVDWGAVTHHLVTADV